MSLRANKELSVDLMDNGHSSHDRPASWRRLTARVIAGTHRPCAWRSKDGFDEGSSDFVMRMPLFSGPRISWIITQSYPNNRDTGAICFAHLLVQ